LIAVVVHLEADQFEALPHRLCGAQKPNGMFGITGIVADLRQTLEKIWDAKVSGHGCGDC
jgi:hypothetical protein